MSACPPGSFGPYSDDPCDGQTAECECNEGAPALAVRSAASPEAAVRYSIALSDGSGGPVLEWGQRSGFRTCPTNPELPLLLQMCSCSRTGLIRHIFLCENRFRGISEAYDEGRGCLAMGNLPLRRGWDRVKKKPVVFWISADEIRSKGTQT